MAALLAWAGASGAHEAAEPKRDRLALGPSEIVLRIEYTVPRGDLARTLRAIFDRDRSGALDEAERAALAKHLASEATAFLGLLLDGGALPLAVEKPALAEGGTNEAAISIALRVRARWTLSAGQHTLELRDRHKDRRIAVPVEIALDERLAWAERPLPAPTVDDHHPLTLRFRLRER